MTGRVIQTAVLVAAVVVRISADQQPPVRDTRPQPTQPVGTGVLAGAVTNEDGSNPVRFAYVLLIGTTTGLVKVSFTDRDGRFTFAGLPADRYTLGASKPPYLGALAGAKRPARPGTPIVLAAGERVTNVAVRLPMSAAITGVVFDRLGQPLVNAAVAVHQWRTLGSERTLERVGSFAMTDDTGTYRFFGLVPGEYVVGALPLSALPARTLTTAEVDAALKTGALAPAATAPIPNAPAPIYFPGTPRVAESQPVVVAPGEERRNVDFRVEAVQMSRVEGTLVRASGVTTPQTVVLAARGGGVLQGSLVARTMPDGRFSFPNVAPGSYRVTATGTGPAAGQVATALVDVMGADVLGLQLVMGPALSVSGTLRFDGETAPPSLAGQRVPVRPYDSAESPPSPTPTTAAGVFTLNNVRPGRYLIGGPLALGPNPATLTWTLQSVVLDDRDVTDLPVELGDVAPRSLTVTYGDKWQGLSGRLQSATGAPVSDVTLVVFPEDRNYWYHASRRIAIARPDTTGRFVISDRGPSTLPPGRYLMATVTDLARDEQFDPSFLATLVPGAVPVALAAGEQKTQDLAVR